jgi:hypothetical protein
VQRVVAFAPQRTRHSLARQRPPDLNVSMKPLWPPQAEFRRKMFVCLEDCSMLFQCRNHVSRLDLPRFDKGLIRHRYAIDECMSDSFLGSKLWPKLRSKNMSVTFAKAKNQSNSKRFISSGRISCARIPSNPSVEQSQFTNSFSLTFEFSKGWKRR